MVAGGALLYTLGACAIPNYTTKHGVAVYCDSPRFCWPKEHVEIVTDVFLGLDAHRHTTRAELDGIHLTIHRAESYLCEASPTGRCAGSYYPETRDIRLGHGGRCVASSSLAHELGHLAQYAYRKHADGKHTNTEYFANRCDNAVCSQSAVVTQTQTLSRRMIICD